MIVTIHQPEHLPWLGYFHKMTLADQYVFLDNVQYRHQYFQNRNRLMGASGPIWVTVPVRKLQHRYGPISDVLIDNAQDWRKNYWGSIEYNYKRHPHFERYAEPLRAILMAPFERLVDLNLALITFLSEAFGIQVPIVRSSDLGVSGFKTDIIQQICTCTKASVYVSGPYGRDYLDEASMKEAGISVQYHDFAHPTYTQWRRKAFTPQLSALDLLMNYGPASLEILLTPPAAPVRPLADLFPSLSSAWAYAQ